jgi:NADPH:quinone reductase
VGPGSVARRRPRCRADPGTELRAAARAELAELAGSGKLDVVVAAKYPLAEAAAATAFVAEGHAGGKVVPIS